jgi:hypothetical protein
LNLHESPHYHLKVARLPIPPLAQTFLLGNAAYYSTNFTLVDCFLVSFLLLVELGARQMLVQVIQAVSLTKQWLQVVGSDVQFDAWIQHIVWIENLFNFLK